MLIFLQGGCGRTMCHLLLTYGSAKQVRRPVPGSAGAFLVSPYSMMWGSYVLCWGCRGVKVLPLLGDFSCLVCLQHLRKIFPLRNTCYMLPPSSCYLGKPQENYFRFALGTLKIWH
jgi:hypothetical protein